MSNNKLSFLYSQSQSDDDESGGSFNNQEPSKARDRSSGTLSNGNSGLDNYSASDDDIGEDNGTTKGSTFDEDGGRPKIFAFGDNGGKANNSTSDKEANRQKRHSTEGDNADHASKKSRGELVAFVSPAATNPGATVDLEGPFVMPDKSTKTLFNPYENFKLDGDKLICSCGGRFGTSVSSQMAHVKVDHEGYHLKTKVAVSFKDLIDRHLNPQAIAFEGSNDDGDEEVVTAPTYSITTGMLEQYRHKKEKTKVYVLFSQRLMAKECNNNATAFDSFMKRHTHFITLPIHSEAEKVLLFGIKLAERWIRVDHAEFLIDECIATMRSKMVLFKDSELDGGRLRTTFTLENANLTKLLDELTNLLKFSVRSKSNTVVPRLTNVLKKFEEDQTYNDMLLPSILVDFYNEVANGTDEITAIETYCMARSMKLISDRLEFKNGSNVASIVSNVLRLLRAGFLTYIALTKRLSFQEKFQLVEKAQDAYLPSSLAGFIKRLRISINLQGHTGKAFIDASGDIHYGDNTYAAETWKTVILTTLARCDAILKTVFKGDGYSRFLDLNKKLKVRQQDSSNAYSFSIGEEEDEVKSCDLELTDNADLLEHSLGKLSMYLELAFDVFGCGPGRLTEIHRMEMEDLRYELGTFSYYLTVIKQPSATVPDSQKVRRFKHTLPTEMARVFLLYREILSRLDKYKNHSVTLPPIRNNRHTIRDAAQDLHDLDEKPSALEIRQVYASYQNVVFMDGKSVDLNCNEIAAEMPGHTANTHFALYCTTLPGAPLTMIRRFHAALGGMPVRYDTSQLSQDKLLEGLRHVLNCPTAKFMTTEQGLLVWYAAQRKFNVHGASPCGGGKSMTWNAVVAARRIHCMETKTTIVLSPYKQLNEHHAAVASKVLASTGATIETVRSSDKTAMTELSANVQGDDRPDLVFISLSAFASLVKHSRKCLDAKFVHRIILDEVHTILSEFYRPESKVLKKLGSLGVPIMTLSGTLHRELVMPLYKYMGLDCNEMKKVESQDLMGRLPAGFYFGCRKVKGLVKAGVEAVQKRLEATPEGSIHVICETKQLKNEMYEALKDSYVVGQVDGDTPDGMRSEISRAWFEKGYQAYISTSCTLVGNESDRCFHVLVIGNIYSPNNAIQAFSRLRPKQRIANGSFEMLYEEPKVPFYIQTDESNWDMLVKEGVLNASTKEPYLKTCSRMSLVRWMENKETCAIIYANQCYDFNPGEACGVCTCCTNRPRAQLASKAKQKKLNDKEIKKAANEVLEKMLQQCLYCGSAKCDGEQCESGKCFKCGLDHLSGRCKEKPVAEIFKRLRTEGCKLNGCYKCLLSFTGNYEKCNCPYKTRIRRVIHHAHETARSNGRFTSYDAFLGHFLAKEERFNRLLAFYKDFESVEQN